MPISHSTAFLHPPVLPAVRSIGWKHPLSWLSLAKDAGADTARHLAIIERYGIE